MIGDIWGGMLILAEAMDIELDFIAVFREAEIAAWGGLVTPEGDARLIDLPARDRVEAVSAGLAGAARALEIALDGDPRPAMETALAYLNGVLALLFSLSRPSESTRS